MTSNNWNINNDSKRINRCKVNMRKKKLNERNKNCNRGNIIYSIPKIAFTELKQEFITVVIFFTLDWKYVIKISINSLSYAISKILY